MSLSEALGTSSASQTICQGSHRLAFYLHSQYAFDNSTPSRPVTGTHGLAVLESTIIAIDQTTRGFARY